MKVMTQNNGMNGQMNNFKEEAKARQEALIPQPVKNLNVNAAMRYIYDQMERCVIYNYIVLGETARAIYDGKQITSPVIEIGIRKAEFTPEVKSLFNQWGYKHDLQTGNWTTTFEGIPITFKIISREYNFFKHLDQRFYDVDEYHIPNPFEKYWKARFLIQ